MKITILCVGKVKESYFRDGITEFVKRLSRYVKMEIIEVADEKTPDHAGEKEEMRIRQKEAERLQKSWRDDAYSIALAIDGKKMDSVAFAERLEQLGIVGESHIQFIIGGSLGLDPEVLRRADERLSFSDMTFPHQLMRVILLEQIYRSYRIINNQPYHK